MREEKRITEDYPIHVSHSGATFIKGGEFINSRTGRDMLRRAAEFGRKHIKSSKQGGQESSQQKSRNGRSE